VIKPFLSIALALCLAACGGAPSSPMDTFAHPPTLGPTPTLPPSVDHDLTNELDAAGRARSALALSSADGWVRLDIPAGTQVTTAQGAPVQHISITALYPGKLPIGSYGYAAGFAYQFGPAEIHFNPSASLVFRYSTEGLGRVLPRELGVGRARGESDWIQYSVKADEAQKEIQATTDSLLPDGHYILVGPAPMGS
jgi:hypothetical protein